MNESTAATVALSGVELPCPFCGRHPKWVGYDGQPADLHSFHWVCACGAQGPRTTGDQVSVAWNRRAAPPATA